MTEKKQAKDNQNQKGTQKQKYLSEGQVKDKPLIDKTSVAPPPATKPKK